MQFVQWTPTMREDIGQRNWYNALPHSKGKVGSWSPATHRHTETLLVGNGQWKSCNVLPHCLWVLGTKMSTIYNIPPQCL